MTKNPFAPFFFVLSGFDTIMCMPSLFKIFYWSKIYEKLIA
ncbi:hypothetical protein ACRE1S_05435 [Helicobacter himalayensis]